MENASTTRQFGTTGPFHFSGRRSLERLREGQREILAQWSAVKGEQGPEVIIGKGTYVPRPFPRLRRLIMGDRQ